MEKFQIDPEHQEVSKNVTAASPPSVQPAAIPPTSGVTEYLDQIAQKLSMPSSNPYQKVRQICNDAGRDVLTNVIPRRDLVNCIVSLGRKIPGLKIKNFESTVESWVDFGIGSTIWEEERAMAKRPQPKSRSKSPLIDTIADTLEFLHSKGLVRDEISDELYIGEERVNDLIANSLYYAAMRDGLGISTPQFTILMRSNEINKVNRVKAFFEAHKHLNPSGNVDKLLESLNTKHSLEYKRLLIPWLVGIVASIDKGNHNVLCAVLTGKKGCGKTEFFRRLLPPQLSTFFCQSRLNLGNKDEAALMTSFLIILQDELVVTKRDAELVRNLLSANTFTYREPYGIYNVTRQRMASLCATSNQTMVILEPEHNRRIIPMEINSVNHELYNSIDKVELFIELYNMYKAGVPWHLSQSEMDLLDQNTSEYEISTSEEELVLKYCEIPIDEVPASKWATATEIKMFIEETSGQSVRLNSLGKALSRLKFESKVVKTKGTTHTSKVYHVLFYSLPF
jgi:hypothetical protein